MSEQDAPLLIQPKFSVWFCLYLSVAFSGAIACIFLSECDWWLQILFSAFAMAAYVYYARQYLYSKNPTSLVYVLLDPVGNSELHLVNGRCLLAELLPNCVISQYLMILRFRLVGSNKRYAVILFYDSESQKCLRELRYRIMLSL